MLRLSKANVWAYNGNIKGALEKAKEQVLGRLIIRGEFRVWFFEKSARLGWEGEEFQVIRQAAFNQAKKLFCQAPIRPARESCSA